ncbi:MAG: ribosomal protein [Rickettsiaceae bacterium]|jgi:large subunit ribosomal protein L15|nr:ribosomal protein [Rickettsiaceae bacterium]
MNLNQLADKSRKNRKRVGRGIGSGTGKTCGRGHKGQKSRTGVAINGFEGGQTPLYRRVPKRGFVNIFRVVFQTINLSELQKFVDSKKIDTSKNITKEYLYEIGIIKKLSQPVKVLAKGTLKASLKIEVDAASASAVKLVEKAGGKLAVIEKKAKAA